MSFETKENAIRDHFGTEFETLEPEVEVQYDANLEFEPGNLEEWVRFTMLPGSSVQASLGSSRRWRNPGVVVVSVFVVAGSGSGRALEIADKVAAIFRGKTVSGVTFRAPSVAKVGPSGAWYQVNVSTPFYFDLDA